MRPDGIGPKCDNCGLEFRTAEARLEHRRACAARPLTEYERAAAEVVARPVPWELTDSDKDFLRCNRIDPTR